MPTTIVPIGGEPTFYLNDLAETAQVGVSGERPVSEMDERPDVTYSVDGVVNTLNASDVQKWFQFIGGKASTDETYPNGGYAGDVMFGVKSNTDCAFSDIPFESPNNTTLRFHQYNLQNDYLGTLAETVFGYAEGANLFSNVPQLKDSYNGALVEVIAKTNALMNDISHTLVNGVDVTKKLANTILKKYPERFELKFGAKIYIDAVDNVPNGHLGYDSTKTPGVNQTTEDWVVHIVNAHPTTPGPQIYNYDKAEVKVTLSDQNTIVDMVLTKEGNGYKFGDRLILCKAGDFYTESNRFVELPSILDVQANTLNQVGNNEDVLFSTTDPKGADLSGNVQNFNREGRNAYITNRLFLPGVTSDATVVCMDYVADANGIVTGTGSTVDVSCTPTGSYTDNSSAAVFEEMTVTNRGGDLRYNAYATGDTLTVSKQNATITHTLTATDAIRLNLGVLTIAGKVIDSSAVFNNDSSGIVIGYNVSDNTTIRGTGAVVDVNTDNLGTDICYNGVNGIPHIIVNTTGSGYTMNDRIQITNKANPTQTIDLSLTRMDANFLNGLTILNIIDLSATITTRSMFSTDGRVPETILCRVTTAAGAIGAIAEVHVGNNGTWVKKITIRDGSYNSPVEYALTDNIVLTNMNGNVSEVIELSSNVFDASFIQALNAGEEYILTDTDGSGSLVDSSNALTHSLTAGIVFDNGETNNVVSYQDASGTPIVFGSGGSGATVYVTTTGKHFEPPVFEINVLSPGSGYVEGDMIRITRNYQTVIKELTSEDATLLNGEPKEIRGINDVRTITSAPIFTDGAFGYATSANSTGLGALIRVDSHINDTSLVRLTVIIPDSGAGFVSGDTVIIQNIQDPTQHITFLLAAVTPTQDELELNNTDSKVLDILITDIPYLFNGGVTKSVRAVKNGIDNKYSEAIVDITCDGSPDGNPDVGAKIEYITVASPAKPGTVGSQDELYYEVGDSVTFTVNEKGDSINRSVAINQYVNGVATTIGSTFSIKYVITIDALTKEQADVLNGKLVGVNVPLLPGDVLAIKSTIESPSGVIDQPQFVQSFITKYSLR